VVHHQRGESDIVLPLVDVEDSGTERFRAISASGGSPTLPFRRGSGSERASDTNGKQIKNFQRSVPPVREKVMC